MLLSHCAVSRVIKGLKAQLTQAASPIHLRHLQSVWAHWYAVHMRCQLVYSSSLKYLYPHSTATSATLSVLSPLLRWHRLLSHWQCQLRWHCHPLCADIMALIVLALPPLLCWHCWPCCAGVAIVCGVVYHVVCNLVYASSMREKTPANQLHNASTMRAKRPAWWGQ